MLRRSLARSSSISSSVNGLTPSGLAAALPLPRMPLTAAGIPSRLGATTPGIGRELFGGPCCWDPSGAALLQGGCGRCWARWRSQGHGTAFRPTRAWWFIVPRRQLAAHHPKAVSHHFHSPAGSALAMPLNASAQLGQPPRAILGHRSLREICVKLREILAVADGSTTVLADLAR